MHCGLCLPTCPTYDATKLERNSPRGRIALMRAIADGRLEATRTFADEMYFCLGCLACMTACPAGVNYAELFEHARAEAEESGVLRAPKRGFIRWLTIRWLFMDLARLRFVGALIRVYQQMGLQTLVRQSGALKLLPRRWRELEAMTPVIQPKFSAALIPPVTPAVGQKKYRVALLTGCAQDLMFSDVNRDTAEVLARNGCEVFTPPAQNCCGSLHAHNGELEPARELARRSLDQFPPEQFDAIISNAAGCGSHLKHYARLLADDPVYREARRIVGRETQGHPRMAGAHRPDAAQAGRDRATCHLPRSLPLVPRAANHRAAAPTPARHSEFDADGIAGEHLVLRQRGHLQFDPAGDGQPIAGPQAQAHREHQGRRGGDGQSRLPGAHGQRHPPGKNSGAPGSSHYFAGGGLPSGETPCP